MLSRRGRTAGAGQAGPVTGGRGEKHGRTMQRATNTASGGVTPAVRRWLRIGGGCVWAAALLLAGWWLWQQGPTAGRLAPSSGLAVSLAVSLAVMATAAAQYVFMALVADDLCPEAPMEVTGFLKLVAALLFVMALVWLIWHGGSRLLLD